MISVLIPAYRWNVFPLVEVLYKQLVRVNVEFEIIVIDDASKDNTVASNKQVATLSNTSFSELKNNIGRSAIRNLLAKKAKYNWLLFLDADVMVYEETFIETYLRAISKNTNVIIGGLAYLKDPLNNLRYKFGIAKEVLPSELRSNEPYRYFFTSNLFIKKDVFNSITFNEELKGYGYEDLLFALQLKKRDVLVHHITNNVYHLGIDSNEEFMQKTKQGLLNLNTLSKNNLKVRNEVKLLNVVKKYSFVFLMLTPFQNLFESLAVKKSSLFFFDLFRATYLFKLLKKS